MAQSALPAAIAARDPAAMRAAIVGELVPVIPSNIDPQTWDPRELGMSGGNVWQAVIWQERIWYRDDTSVADHDEVTVIVLLDGGRYLTNDVRFPGAVKSRAVTTPPDPLDTDPGARPAYGEAWRVPAGASGAWSAHEDDVAMWSARGWQYRPAATGDLHYVEDESAYEHFSAAAAWENGIPLGVTVSSIPPSALIWDGRVQNQTTNAPPSAAQGVAYIIGSAPTGAWAGNAGKLAIRESPGTNSTYVIYAPYVGQRAFDISLNVAVEWNGTAWISAGGAVIAYKRSYRSDNTAFTSSGAGYYAFTSITAPSSANVNSLDGGVSITHAARRSGVDLVLSYEVSASTVVGNGTSAVALFRDNETTAIGWGAGIVNAGRQHYEFVISTNDTASHTYKMRLFSYDDSSSVVVSQRLMQLREMV